jgi:hypothetical protein
MAGVYNREESAVKWRKAMTDWTPKVGDRVRDKDDGGLGTVEDMDKENVYILWDPGARVQTEEPRDELDRFEPLPPAEGKWWKEARARCEVHNTDEHPQCPTATSCLWPACAAEAMFTSSYCEQHSKPARPEGECTCPGAGHNPETCGDEDKAWADFAGKQHKVLWATDGSTVAENKPARPEGERKPYGAPPVPEEALRAMHARNVMEKAATPRPSGLTEADRRGSPLYGRNMSAAEDMAQERLTTLSAVWDEEPDEWLDYWMRTRGRPPLGWKPRR